MLIGLPLLAAPPVIPPVTFGADHEYVVPAGTTPLAPFEGVTVNVHPLHIVAVIIFTEGLGLTFTVTVKLLQVQFPNAGDAIGVTV